MRMNPTRGEPASRFLTHQSEDKLARLLEENADEPASRPIARALTQRPIQTTGDLRRCVSTAMIAEHPTSTDADVERAIRRTFQALRIAVNDEFSALETFLRHLPQCLAAGGRAAILTFHSGEDRRVKKAFQEGERAGVYTRTSRDVVRASPAEQRSNPRARSAKLRWSERAARS
jgi:16S rRNA (cytosine1402-N4)-methyltransferase